MLPICQVCLRTDKQLQTVEESLENWLDELCDFAIESTDPQFCAECVHLLRKFYCFKAKCLRAIKVLNSWMRQKERNRKPLSQLSKQMPISSIGLAKESNCKIYQCKSADLNTTVDLNVIQELNSDNGVDRKYDLTSYEIASTSEKYLHLIAVDCTRTNTTQNQLTINENLPNVNGNQPYDNGNQPYDNGNQQYDNGNQPYENGNQPYENGNQLPDNVDQQFTNKNESDINQQSYNDNQPSLSVSQGDSQSLVFTHVKKETVKLEIDQDAQNFERFIFEEDDSINDVDDRTRDTYDSNSDINQPLDEADIKSDNDSGDDEEIIKKKRRKTEDDPSLVNDLEKLTKKPKCKKQQCKKPFNIEMLKNVLSSRFADCGEVKDKEGIVIDKDCIINSLDKLHNYTLIRIQRRVKETLTPEAIQILSRIQKKYGDQYSSVFKTEHLPTLEDEMAEFNQRQNYECYIKAEHKCEICFSGFKHEKMLDYHVRMFHDMSLPHLCAICQMRFKHRMTLLKHRRKHKAVFKCKLCPLVTNYRSAMVNHYLQHKGKMYKCTLCDNTFKNKSCLFAHMNCMHHSQYICSLCARTFASDAGLSQHKIRKHENEPPLCENVNEEADKRTCEKCIITFISVKVYQRHLERSHKKEMLNVYRRRNRSAPRQKPNFICRVCNAVEHSFSRLAFHYSREHPSVNIELSYSDVYKYLCHICGKGYNSIRNLNDHKYLHTGEKPYACDKCPKTFHRKINLRNHQERHLPPSRECPTCGKKFASASNLNIHTKSHKGVRLYSCEICGKSFLHSTTLKEHVQGVHNHVRRKKKQAKQPEQP